METNYLSSTQIPHHRLTPNTSPPSLPYQKGNFLLLPRRPLSHNSTPSPTRSVHKPLHHQLRHSNIRRPSLQLSLVTPAFSITTSSSFLPHTSPKNTSTPPTPPRDSYAYPKPQSAEAPPIPPQPVSTTYILYSDYKEELDPENTPLAPYLLLAMMLRKIE